MSASEHSAFPRIDAPAIPDRVRDDAQTPVILPDTGRGTVVDGGGGSRHDAALRVGDGPLHQPAAGPPPHSGEEPFLVIPPLASTRARADGWTPERQRGFLEALATCGSVAGAARSVGMTREGAYALRRRADARGFAQAWEAARLLATDHLIDLAWDRVTAGVLRQIYYHGELVGETRQFDNRLLLSLIAQNRALLAESEAAASPAVIGAVVADWEAALDRAERGEALSEADLRGADLAESAPVSGETPDMEEIEPPLAPEPDCHGEMQSEAQLLDVGLYQHWWDAPLGCWLTNWPAPEGWAGDEYRRDADGRYALIVAGEEGEDDEDLDEDDCHYEHDCGDDGKLPEASAPWSAIERYARTLTTEELAGAERAEDDLADARARRLELYRRAAFGLASAAECSALAAVNAGQVVWGER